MKINHIGYVVKSIDKSVIFYCSNLSYEIKVNNIYVSNQDVYITMLKSIHGGPDLELITPASKTSPAYNALGKGSVINHICYQVKNYDYLLQLFKNKIVRKSMPAPFELFNGASTFFAFIDNQVTEFVEDYV